ncbi:Tat pathway signal sequence domain protein OS=Streptomyces fumanus OX=67302 GN=GCM10018772_47520 PE=4 SV=1 [Streptomyces fumanus]
MHRRRETRRAGLGESSTTPTATRNRPPWTTEKIGGPLALVPGTEASWVSTNDTALYGLAAIENLALLGDRMP